VQFQKPRLAEFLEVFEEKIKEVNITYRMYKEQFEKDMKSFRECDIREEEEIIEKSIIEGILPAQKDNGSCMGGSEMEESVK